MFGIKRLILLASLFAIHWGLATPAAACIYNVRDVGFVDVIPRPYHLYCFVKDDTPARTVSALKRDALAAFRDSNVEFTAVNVDREKIHPALPFISACKIESFPALVLASSTGRSLLLPLSAATRGLEQGVQAAVRDVLASPTRQTILKHIVESYCLVLVIEGADDVSNRAVHASVNQSIQKIANVMTQLPKRIQDPPRTLTLPRDSIQKEKILLWSLGIDGNEVEEPSVAVIYGRGRRIGPVLRGEDVTGRRLYDMMSILGQSCECGLDNRWKLGPLLPMRWDSDLQSRVVKHLGFDAESPMVKREMLSLPSLASERRRHEEGAGAAADDLGGYSEAIVQFDKALAQTRISPARLRRLLAGDASEEDGDTGVEAGSMIIVGGGMALLVLAGGIGIVLLGKRRPR